jgi:hypothetical protein
MYLLLPHWSSCLSELFLDAVFVLPTFSKLMMSFVQPRFSGS